MNDTRQMYTSANWWVRSGQEDEFVGRWQALVGTAKEVSGSGEFHLLRDSQNPQHFQSFGSWRDQAAADEWRQGAAFVERMKACRELCERFEPCDCHLAAELS